MRSWLLIFYVLSTTAVTCAPLARRDTDETPGIDLVVARLPDILDSEVLNPDAAVTQSATSETSPEHDETDEPDETHEPSTTTSHAETTTSSDSHSTPTSHSTSLKDLSTAAQVGIAVGICLPFFLLIGLVAAYGIHRGRHKRISILGTTTFGVGAGWIVFRGDHAKSLSNMEEASEGGSMISRDSEEDFESVNERTGFLRSSTETFELDSGWRGRNADGDDIWSPR